ncbi:MAG: VPLPA-CTERM sorting domain-containing protein [Pseudomonadota bacterium]
MKNLTKWAAAAVLSVMFSGAASAAVLDAMDVNASWRFNNINSVYADYGTSVVGAGTEYSNVNVDGNIFFNVDIADTSITVSFNDSFSSFNFASFNGLFITDINNLFPALSVFSVSVSGFTFLASDVFFQSDGFGLDFQGDTFAGGESVTVNFAPANVPLPAALPLLLAALGGIGALKMRRKAA